MKKQTIKLANFICSAFFLTISNVEGSIIASKILTLQSHYIDSFR